MPELIVATAKLPAAQGGDFAGSYRLTMIEVHGTYTMDYSMKRVIPKSEFKIKAFEVCRYVEKTGKSILISDHGKPTLILSPLRDAEGEDAAFFRNSVLRYESPLDPAGVGDWEALG